MPKKYRIGIDVGGTKIKAGLVSEGGRIVQHYRAPTETKRGAKVIMRHIEEAVAAVWHPQAGVVGLGVAGLIDARKGTYRRGPNFPRTFRNIPLGRRLHDKFGLPVYVDNDARCFTLGEAHYGAAKGKANVVGVTLGTGIGSGVIIGRHLYRGRDNAAGEVGHHTVTLGLAEKCSCGRFDHFEALASGTAMEKLHYRRTHRQLLPAEIVSLARKGNRQARRTVKDMKEHLGAGLANIIQILNPDIIVLGGGLSRIRGLLSGVRQEAKRHLAYPELASTPIVNSKLGEDAAVLGASLLPDTCLSGPSGKG